MSALPNKAQGYQDVAHLNQESLVDEHGPLVLRIAKHLMGRFPPSVHIDDLVQAGMVGLLLAAKSYDNTKGASFETYAGIRIRGSMLDELRKGDWVPRSVHRNTRRITAAITAVENRTGRDARDADVAKELNVSLHEYHQMLNDSNSSRLFNFDDTGVAEDQVSKGFTGSAPSPFQQLEKTKFTTNLTDAIKELPERERLLLALYYHEELNFKEIGEVLGVTESRVSQLHSQAMLRLRKILKNWQQRTE